MKPGLARILGALLFAAIGVSEGINAVSILVGSNNASSTLAWIQVGSTIISLLLAAAILRHARAGSLLAIVWGCWLAFEVSMLQSLLVLDPPAEHGLRIGAVVVFATGCLTAWLIRRRPAPDLATSASPR